MFLSPIRKLIYSPQVKYTVRKLRKHEKKFMYDSPYMDQFIAHYSIPNALIPHFHMKIIVLNSGVIIRKHAWDDGTLFDYSNITDITFQKQSENTLQVCISLDEFKIYFPLPESEETSFFNTLYRSYEKNQ